MADKAHSAIDKRLQVMERRLSRIYEEAQAEIEAKATEYFKEFELLDEKKRQLVEKGRLGEEEYEKWHKNKLLYGKRWTRIKKKLAIEYENIQRKALAYINDELPEIYSISYNATGKDFESKVKGYSFDLVNPDTVRELAKDDRTFLPLKEVNGSKYQRWCTHKINSEIMKGIMLGDSVPNLAKRLSAVTDMDKAAAVRNARTMVTSAENKARQDGFERAKENGIVFKRKWMAAIDNRTRHAHALLNGTLADPDEPFHSELGDIMYPGDPDADPANVYNCRCTLGSKIIGFKKKDGSTVLIEEDDSGIIKEGMYRKTSNTGVFEVLPERMSKKHIRNIAKEVGINLKGIKMTIDTNPELLYIPYTGRADPENIGGITFFPNAFRSREDLIRTLYHEKIHVEQYKKYSPEYVQNNRILFEKEAYELENTFIKDLKERGML